MQATFRGAYGHAPTRLVWAPGRVNLIGGHVDYNQGVVLPVAIDRGVIAGVRGASDGRRRAVARRFGGPVGLDEALDETPVWARPFAALPHVLAEAGVPVGGFDLAFDGDLPIGEGLSSSAASLAAAATALLDLVDVRLDPIPLAKICQAAERRGLGVRCGLMDPLVVLAARAGHALALDCRDLTHRHVPLDPLDAALVIFPTRDERTLATSAYNDRRRACERGVAAIQRIHPEVESLRDVLVEEWLDEGALSDSDRRRCRHVVHEIRRAEAACAALEAGDLEAVGALMYSSHHSLKRLYEVTTDELDALVEACHAAPESYGGRVTGAGFGGSTVHLVRPEGVSDFVARVQSTVDAQFSWRPTPIVSGAVAGALADTA